MRRRGLVLVAATGGALVLGAGGGMVLLARHDVLRWQVELARITDGSTTMAFDGVGFGHGNLVTLRFDDRTEGAERTFMASYLWHLRPWRAMAVGRIRRSS